MAYMAPLMVVTVLQIVPPLKVWGDSVSSVHISASFSFHVVNAFSKLSTIQLLSKCSPPIESTCSACYNESR